MELISLPASPFAARVRIAVYAKGLPVDIVPPPADWRESRAFRDFSPAGRVPVLLDEGGALWESAVLVEYLEERFPDPPLTPVGVLDRATARLLVQCVDLYLTPPLAALADPRTDGAGARRAVEDALNSVMMIDRLLTGPRYALCDELSIADCALAPALFAVGMTGERIGLDLLEPGSTLHAYARMSRQDPHIGRVIDEMEEGMRLLTRTA